MKNQITSEERKELIEEIKNKYNKYKEKVSNKRVKEIKDEFIDLFKVCESLYKIVLKKYLLDNNKYKNDKEMILNYNQITASLKMCQYSIDEELIKKIFSSVGKYAKKGSKSAKVLRNEVEHSLSTSSIDEIIERKDELFKYMRDFIRYLKK